MPYDTMIFNIILCHTIDAVKSQYTKPVDMPDLHGDDLDSAIRALITYLSAVSIAMRSVIV